MAMLEAVTDDNKAKGFSDECVDVFHVVSFQEGGGDIAVDGLNYADFAETVSRQFRLNRRGFVDFGSKAAACNA